MKAVPIFIFSILAVFLICGCTEQKPVVLKTCCEYARERIPSNLTLVKYYVHPVEKVYVWTIFGNDRTSIDPNYTQSWNDGTKFDTKSICFMQGSNKGQSIYLYYETPCAYGGTAHVQISFSKKVVDIYGEIVGTNYFSFTPILVPINGSENKIKVYNHSSELFDTMDFAIQNVVFSKCYWINGSSNISSLEGCSVSEGGTPKKS